MLCSLCISLQAQVAYAHPDLKDEVMTQKRLRDLMLGRRNTWSDGSAVILILVREKDCAAAVDEITGMSLPRLLRGWKRLVYTGGGAMPIVVDTPDAAIALAARRRGSFVLLADKAEKTQLSLLYTSKSTNGNTSKDTSEKPADEKKKNEVPASKDPSKTPVDNDRQ